MSYPRRSSSAANERITIRLTKLEHKLWSAQARHAGQSLGEFVRTVVASALARGGR